MILRSLLPKYFLRQTSIVLIASVASPLLARPVPASPTVDKLAASQKAKIDEMIGQYMADSKIKGIEVAIVKGTGPSYECGYGTANELGAIPGPDTKFQIDSLTKSFTAIALFRLIEQGKLDLSKSFDTYVPNAYDAWKKLPVATILGMTSGVPTGGTATGSYQDVLRRIANTTTSYGVGLAFEPGSQFLYSNCNYFLLGNLIQAVTHEKYLDFVRHEVLAPLEMKDTGFVDFQVGKDWATPYHEDMPIAARDGMCGFSGGGFTSTVHDLEKFAIGLSQRKILGEASYRKMWTPTVLTSGPRQGESINWGPGWDKVAPGNGVPRMVTKGGSGYGWRCVLTYYPARDTSVIVLTNSDKGKVFALANSIGDTVDVASSLGSTQRK